MKLFSKTTACICAVIIATSAATVISVNAAKITAPSTSSAQTESSKTKLAEENVKYGKVTAVDGNKITVALGEFAAKTKTTDDSTSSEKAAKKKKSSDSTEAQSGDSSSAEKTVTKKHRHKGRHSGSFTENGTSLTVTVTDNITIEKKGETAAVRDMTLDSLMKNISMVFQNVYLFSNTVENNIKFGRPDATHEQVMEAAKKACCHDFIMQLPDGYETVLEEGGGSLSGGERQRPSIARAILKDSPIIILDEATANVDSENEDRLQAAIEALMKDKTIIMIAHRLKTVRRADQILVLDGGHIVQRGTHAELAKQDGIYSRFISQREQAESWHISGQKA